MKTVYSMQRCADRFDTVLELGGNWALGAWDEVDEMGLVRKLWIAIHFHTLQGYGHYLKRGSKCSICGTVFPIEVIGMRNMFDGLEG